MLRLIAKLAAAPLGAADRCGYLMIQLGRNADACAVFERQETLALKLPAVEPLLWVDTTEERGIPPYLIFSDASLREMARERPTSNEAFLQIKGVGLRKLQELGPRFLARIREHKDDAAPLSTNT